MRNIKILCLPFLIWLSACSNYSTLPPTNETKRYSLQFDGANDWIDVGDSNCLEMGLHSYTFELWFKTAKKDSQQQLIRKGFDRNPYNEGRWVISIDKNNVIRIIVDDVNSTFYYRGYGQTIVTDNMWHHLSVVFDRDSALIVYLDGEIEINDSNFRKISSSIHNNDSVHVYIGRSNSHGLYFKGNLFDIRIWDYARPHNEIRENLFTVYSGTEDKLICYYKMSEGKGQWLYDHAAKNHGQFGSTKENDENDPGWSDSLPSE